MGLTARQGSPVEVIVQGEDEAAALTVLEKLVTDRFGEEG
ncbi:phosphocarrier protein HPr [Rickettsiella grylli]|nr:phosphocarrier protein HPr [Rickettsiella grylli]